MATFTLQLNEVLELTDDIGLNDYPIFDEEYRKGLNKKIVDHFYTREIGVETIDMFRLFMRRKMNEIMPLYNQLYKSERMALDPLNTFNMRTITTTDQSAESEGSTNSTGETDSTADAKSRAVQSQTPQVMLKGNADYATAASDNTSETKTNSSATEAQSSQESSQATGTSDTMVTGWQGYQSDLLMRFRATFLNIDLMIIDELEPLFMNVYGNGDNYTQNTLFNGFGYGYNLGYFGRFL